MLRFAESIGLVDGNDPLFIEFVLLDDRNGLVKCRVAPREQLLARRHDLELVIFGHCHTPTLKSVADRRFYINTGDWVQHRTFTVVTEEAIEQEEYEVAKSS